MSHPALRLGFAGTPAFAATILEALVAAGRTPAVVYTQPDRGAGRGRTVRASPVKNLAVNHRLPVRQPRTLRDPGEAAHLAGLELDVLVVAAYGLLLPRPVLEAPRLGCINVHASLLPRWRGAAPVERAILAGDRETGVCIMHMDEGLDTGPVYLCRRCAIGEEEDAESLTARLAELGGQTLLECLENLPGLVPAPQPEQGVTYARKLRRQDAVVRWASPAADLVRQVRALGRRMPPFARADGVQVGLLEASAGSGPAGAEPGTIVAADRRGIRIACGEGLLNVTRLKLSAGKGKPLGAAEAINGYGRLFRVGGRLEDGAASP